jgi:hypothetical protein
MNMGGNHIALGPIHIAQLLGKVVGGKKLDAFGLVVIPK